MSTEKKRYKVIGTHGPNAKFIAEHALALSLACSRRLVFHTQCMKKGEFPQTDIYHLTLFKSSVLVLGFGPIGRYTAGLFKRTFNAHITIYKRNPEIPHLYDKIVNHVITHFSELLKILPNFSVIINTLPLILQTENLLSSVFSSG